MNNTYKTLVKFWNKGFVLTDEDRKEIESSTGSEEDLKGFAPSHKLFDIFEAIGFWNVYENTILCNIALSIHLFWEASKTACFCFVHMGEFSPHKSFSTIPGILF